MKTAIVTAIVLLAIVCWPKVTHSQEAVRKPTRTPTYTKEGTESCLRCHSGEKMRAVAASPHGNADIQGSPETVHGCESCHGPGSIHVSRAHGGRGFPPLTRFGRGEQYPPREEQLHACLSCHGEGSENRQPIVFFGSAHDRNNINCSTCHSAHVESDPIALRETQLTTCGRCHRRHIREHPRFEEKSIDFDALSCSACHDAHAPPEPE